jgi:hypothetical protein
MKPKLGVILSDMPFRRPVGDVGNPASYNYPVIVHVARGVTAEMMVRAVPNADLVSTYLEAALTLQIRGAAVITTTCGFLVSLQEAIASKLAVPFVASSLLQIPMVYRLRGGRIGIITANDEALSRAHLDAAGIATSLPVAIAGLQRYPDFANPLLHGKGEIDLPKVERCVLETADQLLREWPDITAFLLECHNLPPFSAAVRLRTGKPVFDILSIVTMALQGMDQAAVGQRSQKAS